MDDQQRAHFNNAAPGVPFEIKATSASFTTDESNTAGFSEPMVTKYNSDTDSEENTEFNYRCSMCNFTYR